MVSQRRVVIEVGRDDAEQVVGVAEEPFGVPDLRYRGERGFEGGDGSGVPAIQRDADDGFEAEADRGRVQDGAVAGDDAGALQLAQPPVTRRRRPRSWPCRSSCPNWYACGGPGRRPACPGRGPR